MYIQISNLYKQDPNQATSIADPLDEPIDVEVPNTNEESEEFLPFGTHQFKQESTVTVQGITYGLIEIF